jgi:hypothetical protein
MLWFLSDFSRARVRNRGRRTGIKIATNNSSQRVMRFQVIAPLVRSSSRLFVCAAIAHLGSACHDGSWRVSNSMASSAAPTPAAPVPPPPPVVASEPTTNGYFSGTIFVGGFGYYGEALLTVDGLVRIYLAGPFGAYDSAGSRQFTGRLEFVGGQGRGAGVVLKQDCQTAGTNAVCLAEPAEISVTTATRSQLAGQIALTNNGEIWSFQMRWPTTTYLEPATLEFAAGQYSEQLTGLAVEAVVTVDGNGRVFFQSARSGCIGNGTLTPHLDGTFNVYDAALRVENCSSGYDSGNGEFQGLATRTIGDPWSDWGDWLLIWLSTPDGTTMPQAFVMWGNRIP